MNETTERFLQEIATRVGYDRVAELYLFPVLRQGGVEGAVAVVAAYPDTPEGAEESQAPEPAGSVPSGNVEAADEVAPAEAGEAEPEPAEASEASEVSAADDANGAPAEEARVAGEDEPADERTDVGTHTDTAADGTEAASGGDVLADAPTGGARESRVRARHVVYTARYRHTIKGTDRGRWVVEVVAEADAPLITVEEVVRGVVRRSGDEFQPERLSGEQFRALVPAPAAPGSAPA